MPIPSSEQHGTNFIYNEIGFRNTELQEFEQIIEYDESGSDMLFSKFRVSVTGKIHVDEAFLVDGTLDLATNLRQLHPHFGVDTGEAIRDENDVDPANHVTTMPNAVSTEDRLQRYLMQPRKTMELWIADQRLLYATQSTSKTSIYADPWAHDVNNGPKPISVKVTKVVGLNMFHVDMTIEVSLAMGDKNKPDDLDLIEETGSNFDWSKNATTPFGILHNRWQMIETRDKNFMLSRTIAGKLRVRNPAFMPKSYVYLVIPPLARDMQRVSQQYTESPNGLEMTYTVTDKQRIAAPPRPAIDWTGQYRSNIRFPANASSVDVCNVSVTGAPGTDKESLFFAALELITNRLGDVRDDQGDIIGPGLHKSYTLVDIMHENTISLAVSVQRPIVKQDSLIRRYSGMPYYVLGRLSNIQATAPAWDPNTKYLPGAIVTYIGKKYQAKKLIPGTGAGFNSNEWLDVDALLSAERNDRNGVYLDQWPQPMPYDPNSNMAQFANYWQNPSVDKHGFPSSETGSSIDEPTPQTVDEWAQIENNNEASNNPSTAVYGSASNYSPVITQDNYDNISQSHRDNIYTEVQIDITYDVRTGIRAMPRSIPQDEPTPDHTVADQAARLAISSPTVGDIAKQTDNDRFYKFLGGDAALAINWRDYYASAMLVQTQAPIQHRMVYFKGSRVADIPSLPPLQDILIDPNIIVERLIDYQILPDSPKLVPNGTGYLYEVEGHMTYAAERIVQPGAEKFKAGSLPWDLTSLAANALQYGAHESTEIA